MKSSFKESPTISLENVFASPFEQGKIIIERTASETKKTVQLFVVFEKIRPLEIQSFQSEGAKSASKVFSALVLTTDSAVRIPEMHKKLLQ